MLGFDQRQQAERRGQVGGHVAQDGQHCEDPGQPGLQRLSGRSPDGRAGVVVGGVAATEREVVRLHLGAEVGPQARFTTGLVAEDVGRDRVIEEGPRHLCGHGGDVARCGTPDYWQGRFENHDGVDGGRGPGHPPPGDVSAWAWPRAASSGARRWPT